MMYTFNLMVYTLAKPDKPSFPAPPAYSDYVQNANTLSLSELEERNRQYKQALAQYDAEKAQRWETYNQQLENWDKYQQAQRLGYDPSGGDVSVVTPQQEVTQYQTPAYDINGNPNFNLQYQSLTPKYQGAVPYGVNEQQFRFTGITDISKLKGAEGLTFKGATSGLGLFAGSVAGIGYLTKKAVGGTSNFLNIETGLNKIYSSSANVFPDFEINKLSYKDIQGIGVTAFTSPIFMGQGTTLGKTESVLTIKPINPLTKSDVKLISQDILKIKSLEGEQLNLLGFRQGENTYFLGGKKGLGAELNIKAFSKGNNILSDTTTLRIRGITNIKTSGGVFYSEQFTATSLSKKALSNLELTDVSTGGFIIKSKNQLIGVTDITPTISKGRFAIINKPITKVSDFVSLSTTTNDLTLFKGTRTFTEYGSPSFNIEYKGIIKDTKLFKQYDLIGGSSPTLKGNLPVVQTKVTTQQFSMLSGASKSAEQFSTKLGSSLTTKSLTDISLTKAVPPSFVIPSFSSPTITKQKDFNINLPKTNINTSINLIPKNNKVNNNLGKGMLISLGLSSLTSGRSNQQNNQTQLNNIRNITIPQLINISKPALKNLSGTPKTPIGFGLDVPNIKRGGILPFKFRLDMSGDLGGRGFGFRKIRSQYTPSYSAFVFNIRGKKPKGRETGVRLRPITKGFSWSKIARGLTA